MGQLAKPPNKDRPKMPDGEAHGRVLWAKTVPMTDEGLLDHLANSKL